ncbi:MAG: PqqD family peptide modification chaperone [bacterium]
MNEAGYCIVSLCDGHTSVKEIAQLISRQYGISFDSSCSDVKTFIRQLAQDGFLSASDPTHRENNLFGKLSPGLRKINLNITERCNLRCRHCAVTDGREKRDYLSTEQIFRIIDEAQESGNCFLTLGGGEPLMREDCIKILSYAAPRVKTGLNTNATLIDDYLAGVLADLGVSLQISLDGPGEFIHDFIRGKGAFGKTLQAIDLLIGKGAGKRIAFCVTISRNNIEYIPDILALASEKGISSLRFVPIQAMGSARVHWDKLALSTRDYTKFYTYMYQKVPSLFPGFHISPGFHGFLLYFSAGQTMWCQIGEILALDAQGWLYPCPLLMEPEFRLGKIQKMSLQQAVESEKMAEIQEVCRRRKDDISRCRACAWHHFCQAGCAGTVYQSKGTFHEVDDLCELRQKMYPQTIFGLAAEKCSSSGSGHKWENIRENACN